MNSTKNTHLTGNEQYQKYTHKLQINSTKNTHLALKLQINNTKNTHLNCKLIVPKCVNNTHKVIEGNGEELEKDQEFKLLKLQ